MRIVIVVRESLADAANDAVVAVTGNPANADTFTDPLIKNGSTVARWCNWEFNGRPYQAQAVFDRFVAELGVTSQEVATQATESTWPSAAGLKVLAFRADQISPWAVLDHYSLTRAPDPEG